MPTDTPVTRLALTTKPLGLSVCQIAAVLNVAPSTTSGYLAELRRADLVTEQREDKGVTASPTRIRTPRSFASCWSSWPLTRRSVRMPSLLVV